MVRPISARASFAFPPVGRGKRLSIFKGRQDRRERVASVLILRLICVRSELSSAILDLGVCNVPGLVQILLQEPDFPAHMTCRDIDVALGLILRCRVRVKDARRRYSS